MNTLRYFALNTLRWAICLCWWSLLLLTPILAFLGFKFAGNDSVIRVAVPVVFRASGVKVMNIQEDNFNKIITATHGRINVSFDANWKNKIAFILCVAAGFLGALVVIYQVRKILKSLSYDEPFEKSNFYRLRVIALILVGTYITKVLILFAIEKITLSAIRFHHVEIAYFNDVALLWTGLTMLVLEAVFKRGTDLEEVDQLTI